MEQAVYVNRILNMKKIKVIGFDMDHTLIRYHTEHLESLVYDLVVDKLITLKGYPARLKQLKFHFNDVIRGLIVDSQNGNILKLSRYSAIRQSYHGTKEISFDEQKKIYHSVYVDLKDTNYIAIDTSFSIAFCVLYSQLVDLKDEAKEILPDYATMARDALFCVDKTHSDGSLKDTISKNLPHYVMKDEQLVRGLQQYQESGKMLFILTNSAYAYSKLLLDYAINPFLPQGKTWQDLFTYVITLANKPRFFYDNLKFLRINPVDGTMTNVEYAMVPGVYQGGNARKFTDEIHVSGDEILYIGDHIYGDILRLKKDCNWRTALVVEELGDEIRAQAKASVVEDKICELMDEKVVIEQTVLANQHDDVMSTRLSDIDKQLGILLREEQQFYNPRWGRVFRAGIEETYFAYQVERFACIYMEKLADLLRLPPQTYFRAPRQMLPHDF